MKRAAYSFVALSAFVLALNLFVGGCAGKQSETESTPTKTEQSKPAEPAKPSASTEAKQTVAMDQVFKDIYKVQFDALAKGDVEAYMSTFDPSSPSYEPSKQMVEAVKGIKIVARVDKVEILSQTEDACEARLTVTTTSTTPGFKSNTTVQKNTLKKINGKWLITGGTIEDVKYK